VAQAPALQEALKPVKVRACQRLTRAYTLTQYMISGTYTMQTLERLHEVIFGRKTLPELPGFPDTMIILSDAIATYIMSAIQDAITVFCLPELEQHLPELQKQTKGEKSEGGSS